MQAVRQFALLHQHLSREWRGRLDVLYTSTEREIDMPTRLIVPDAQIKHLEAPTVFFTVHDGVTTHNPFSCKVLDIIARISECCYPAISCHVLASADDSVRIDHHSAVVIFDGDCRNQFSPLGLNGGTKEVPCWASKARWGVVVSRRCTNMDRCARHTLATFIRNFQSQLQKEPPEFPWGSAKRGMLGPQDSIAIDQKMMQKTLDALNSGPDVASTIASEEFAKELPRDTRISWIRIPPRPLGYNAGLLQGVVDAMRGFEEASGVLIREDTGVREKILAGVVIPDGRLYSIYADPGVPHFSVARPDVHWRENGVSVSENDEMPGGMPQLVHLDKAYGVNAGRWKTFFDWLTERGPLVFVVSHKWSKPYIPEIRWLVSYLCAKGYPAMILTTDQMDDLQITGCGVFLKGTRVGTIWRQFPIFEAACRLADLVIAAHQGIVRMVPEFAHYGNKTWFHIFKERIRWYEDHMRPQEFHTLRSILPESHLIHGAKSFPVQICDIAISTSKVLKELAQKERNALVLKICGANNLAARSRGVLIGEGINEPVWSQWIEDKLSRNQPFLIQERFPTGVVRIPVYNTASNRDELFAARVLMRPWVYNGGEIVSVHGCAVPKEYFKVHGMVSMAVVPVVLQ